MPFKSSNQHWLSKISLQILVWLCDQSCLRGTVYCLILENVDKFTCAFLLVVIWKKVHSNHSPSCIRFCKKCTQEGMWTLDSCKYFSLILIHSNTFLTSLMYNLVQQLSFLLFNHRLYIPYIINGLTRHLTIIMLHACSIIIIMCNINVRLITMGIQQFSMVAIQ